MSRYFFNFRQGDAYSADDVGIAYDSAEQAYLAAFQGAQDMWRELLIAREDPLLCAFEITDAAGQVLFSVSFGEVLEACRGDEANHPFVSNCGAFLEAVKRDRRTTLAMSNIASGLSTARATLRETTRMLAGER
jgi:hypothetical protein